MTDILIAFIFGAFTGAGLLIFTACMIVGRMDNENMRIE